MSALNNLWYNNTVRLIEDRTRLLPSPVLFQFREGSLTMLENQPTPPLLLQDLGMQYATEKSKKKTRFGIYHCECGSKFKAQIASIKNGHTKSCGCYHNQCSSERMTTHGLNSHRLYKTWAGMIDRTTNKNRKHFKNYGGRGITVCDEWRNDFKAFYDWAIDNGYKEGLEIDRIDNNGNYEPYNCRWSTRAVQNRNTKKLRSTNKSGYRGVFLHKRVGKWMAQIVVNSKKKTLRLFQHPHRSRNSL